MVDINDKKLCENCFEELKISHCPNCGYDPSDKICNPTLLLPGSVLSEKYIVGGVIGVGGFGVTYLAYDKSAQRKVAVKEYFPRDVSHRVSYNTDVVVDDPAVFDAGAEKLYYEAKMVSELKENPNIVKIYDIIRANNTVYLIMEFLRGKTIREYICDCGVLDAPSASNIACSVLNALSTLHGVNVLHRDISPDNIILCGNGGVKLIDFGAARRVVEERTQNFSTIVKYGFAPPEQYRKKTEQGAWSDIYSLGSTIYYALTGDIPADPMSRFDNDDTFNENNFGIEDDLWSVIEKATRLNIEERYQNVEEMREALDKLSYSPKPVTFSDEKLFRPIFKSRRESASAVPNASDAEVRNVGNKGFWDRHGRTITAAAIGFAAAATGFSVLLTLNTSKPLTPDTTSSDSSFSSSTRSKAPSPAISPTPAPETQSVPLTETFPYFGEYESKAWYHNLNEDERELYKIIYDGLVAGNTEIEIPPHKYTREDTDKCYYECVYDNPWLCNVGSYGTSYEDENNNQTRDPEEFIYSLQPEWLQFDMDADEFREQIEKEIYGDADTIEKLRRVHDAMVHNVAIVARYVNQSCTHAYGSIVHEKADDMGIAQGFCVYAQAMGLPCRVIDGTKNGEVRAWCAVKIDETWYNVDVYGDLFAHSIIDGNINANRDMVFHTYFLANDEYFKEMGYEPNGGWEVLGGEEFAADSPFDNYYIRSVEDVEEYFNKDTQSAYDSLLRKAAEAAENGTNEISVCIAPYLVNELHTTMNETFISDCKEKYGISVSGYRVNYDPLGYYVKLTL
ncbi:MAG: protein kinase [Ruminococcaceae bacterium]|nr:protein kinase [Oscillospiraceae bacterium]